MSLSNVGSYTSWIAEFANSRCSRTVDASYGTSVISQKACWWIGASYGDEPDSFSFRINSQYSCSTNGCVYNGGFYGIGGHAGAYGTCTVYSNNYGCPSGGSLSGSICIKINTEYKAFSSF